MTEQSRWLDRIERIKVNISGERRAPHKPLLLLFAISRLIDGRRELPFREVEETLIPLLKLYAPPVTGRHQPALPYWYLQTDGLWEIPGATHLPRQAGGFPRMEALRSSSGHLSPDLAKALTADRGLADEIVQALLDQHFPPSLHEDICAAMGLELPRERSLAEPAPRPRRRDPAFRDHVLRAYEHRCAASGFGLALGGSAFGCEAAHVRWVAYDGPDAVENGIALEPTLHKLFDAGAWSLTDDRRILISADLTGELDTIQRIRALHGQSLRSPVPGNPAIALDFIRWHRDEKHGGVFRTPALPL